MALVAYSDDSDLGSDEEIYEDRSQVSENGDGIIKAENKNDPDNSKPNHNIASNVVSKLSSNTPNGNISSNTSIISGIDSIVDEDEEEYLKTESRGILESIPAARSSNSFSSNLDVNEDTDMITDVPTVDTWELLKELKEKNILPNGNENKSSTDLNVKPTTSKEKEKRIKEQELKKKKIQFIIPALSEFSDDEEEEKIEPEKKKIKASSKGTGLFALLPEPKSLYVKQAKRSLVPHTLTKRTLPAPVKKKPKPFKKTDVTIPDEARSDSEDDESGSGDFFSLSAKGDIPSINIGVPVNVSSAPEVPVLPEVPIETRKLETRQPIMGAHSQHNNEQPYTNPQVQTHEEESTSGFIPFGEDNSLDSSNSSHGMDEEALRRLMGKKGMSEAINFINVSADDGLLTRDEWMTKALTEEKPTHSFSKKQDGLPSQKQKQKHQITYLAHQAKERELELKNNWASNRMNKLQTQAK